MINRQIRMTGSLQSKTFAQPDLCYAKVGNVTVTGKTIRKEDWFNKTEQSRLP